VALTCALALFCLPSELSIRHFTEGRMKCQAFVAFPTEEVAERVLDKVHGVVLQGKPLVVVRLRLVAMFTDQPSQLTARLISSPVLSQATISVRVDGNKSATVGSKQTKQTARERPSHTMLI